MIYLCFFFIHPRNATICSLKTRTKMNIKKLTFHFVATQKFSDVVCRGMQSRTFQKPTKDHNWVENALKVSEIFKFGKTKPFSSVFDAKNEPSHEDRERPKKILPFEAIPGPKPLPLIGNTHFFSSLGMFFHL